MSGQMARGLNAIAAVLNYAQQLWPGAAAYGLDVNGEQVNDTGSSTSRTSTLTVWSGPVANGPSSGWTSSLAKTANWTSVGTVVQPTAGRGGPDETSRNAAVYGSALQQLTDAMIAQLGGVS